MCEEFATFLTTVAAEAVAYYICKWLDGLFHKDSKH